MLVDDVLPAFDISDTVATVGDADVAATRALLVRNIGGPLRDFPHPARITVNFPRHFSVSLDICVCICRSSNCFGPSVWRDGQS